MGNLVSVIITTKNEEKYLRKTLDAIKNQTYRPIEIIVSDACSTDNTVKIAKKHADKVIVKDTIMPVGRNLGASYAKGAYLVFIDADIILSKNWIKSMVDCLNGSKYVAAYGEVLAYEKGYRKSLVSKLMMLERRTILNRIYSIGGTAFIVRKSDFLKVGGFTDKFVQCEDIDFALRLQKVGHVKFLSRANAYIPLRRIKKDGYFNVFFRHLSGAMKYLLNKNTGTNYPEIR